MGMAGRIGLKRQLTRACRLAYQGHAVAFNLSEEEGRLPENSS